MKTFFIILVFALITVGVITWWKKKGGLPTLPPINYGRLWVVLGGLVLFVLLVFMFRSWLKKPAKDEATGAGVAQYYVPTPPEVPTLRTWDKIPKEGIRVCLRRGWHTFPLGGGIKITDPDGGEIFDRPGERVKVGFRSEGWYTISPDPLGSERGVQILAKWCGP